jgi:hypothetical protein
MRSFANNLAACATLGVVIAGPIPALAAGYPDHAVKVIVPFAAGGPTDVMARLIAQKLSESLKQQFYVEDHAGARRRWQWQHDAVSPGSDQAIRHTDADRMRPDQNSAGLGLGDWYLEALHNAGRPWLTKLDESHDQYLQERNGIVFVLHAIQRT